MGSPMACHLARNGHDVAGFNRTPSKVEPLVQVGGRRATNIPDAVADADVVALMLPDSPDVEGALTSAGGVFASAQPGALIIDFSTIRPDVSREMAKFGADRGFRVLDAPVSGGEQGAIDASLSIMVGADAADFDVARPILAAVGKTIVNVGPPGAGQTVKAANQLIVAGTIQLVAEAIVFLEAHGVDMPSALQVLGGGLAGSTVLERKGRGMLERNFNPGFRIALHDKDLGIVTAAAREVGVVTPLGALVAQLVSALNLRGDGNLDHTALLKLVSELSGR
jgi:2-hydroxy-3-oxopropionate reductase